MLIFRDLEAEEIDVRVATISEKGCSLLLYKDARCDMNILDETVGVERWQRSHELINGNLYCNVAINFPDANGYEHWVCKQDVGTESFTEKEKGQASDSFKRACFNWGIGRELYTAPFIWVSADKVKIEPKNGKFSTYDKFRVAEIEIENKKITKLSIMNEKTGVICFNWKNGSKPVIQPAPPAPVICPVCNTEVKPVKKDGKIVSAADVLKGCGNMCYSCYKKQKEQGTQQEG